MIASPAWHDAGVHPTGMRLAGPLAALPKSRIPKDAVLWSRIVRARLALTPGGGKPARYKQRSKGTALESPLARNIAGAMYNRAILGFPFPRG